jgi:DNA-directed RNA polymerase specialized sigma24 family protein
MAPARPTSYARRTTRPVPPLDRDRLFDDPQGFVPRLIRKNAIRLALRPEFRGTDPDDLAQELTCDLVKRLPSYNPLRGRLTTFLFRVLRREAADLVEKATARKRRGRRTEHPLGDLALDETDGRRHRGAVTSDPCRQFELNHDLARVAERLSPHLRRTCANAARC